MKILNQILIIFFLCLCGEAIAKILPISFPASVISMILLLILLIAKIIKPHQIKEVSEFLLQHMAFFFVPAGVYILGSFDEIRHSILPLFAVCFLTTVITFLVTVYTVMGVMKLMKKKGGDKID